MIKTYETKVITVIYKNGLTCTFENCLHFYETECEYNIIFACDNHKLMVARYRKGDVAMIAKGYVESEDPD